MGKSAPKSPDYGAIAQQQGAANLETAIQQGYLNNPNFFGPQGYTTTTFDPSTHQPTVQQHLSPDQQALYDMSVHAQQGALGQLEHYGPGRIGEALSSSFTTPGEYQRDFAAGYKPPVGYQFGIGQKPPTQMGLDYSGAPQMPVADRSVRDQVSDSIYNQGARFLDKRFGDQQNALDTRLSNQGLFPGSEAFTGRQGELNDARTTAYNDLVDRAVVGGGDAMAQLFGMGMGARQQGVGELTTQGQFANQAQAQTVEQLLQELSARNSGVGAAYNTAGQQAALANSGKSMADASLAQSKILPVNVMNSILSGTQVQAPQGQAYNPTNIQPAPLMQGAQMQGQADINKFNAQQAGTGNWLNAGSSLGGALIRNPTALGTIFSDRRLKTNVERLGRLENGLTVYAYDIFGRRAVGVMADEVEQVLPEAVSVDADGYKMVDYAMLGLK